MRNILFMLCFCAIVLPAQADAYKTKNQTALQINETTTIYSIEYGFGHGSWDYYLPAQAARQTSLGLSASKRVGFEVLEDSKRHSDEGTVQTAIVSNVPIVDGMYKIPKGTYAKFTLYVILTTDKDDLEADYAIQVTDLPFYRGDVMEKLQLNPTELQYYITPEAEFNASNPSRD